MVKEWEDERADEWEKEREVRVFQEEQEGEVEKIAVFEGVWEVRGELEIVVAWGVWEVEGELEAAVFEGVWEVAVFSVVEVFSVVSLEEREPAREKNLYILCELLYCEFLLIWNYKI